MFIRLKKWMPDFDNASAGYYFYFQGPTQWDLTEQFVSEQIEIERQLEFDRAFNFTVSYTTLLFNNNSIMNTEFTKSNFENYVYGIEIESAGKIIFAGKINPENTFYDKIGEGWEIECIDWLKYHFDHLANRTWDTEYTDLKVFLTYAFAHTSKHSPAPSIIQNINIDVQDESAWIYDAKTTASIASGLFTLQDLLIECQKHYGAYIYIDGEYRLHFVNRQKYSNYPNYVDITENILYDDYITSPFKPNDYDGFVINQKTDLGGGIFEISWYRYRYENGTIYKAKIADENALKKDGERYELLDLRQYLFAHIQQDGSYIKEFDNGYILFPQRTEAEILADYDDLIYKKNFIECIVWGVELYLLNRVRVESTYYLLSKLTEIRHRDDPDNPTYEIMAREI